MLKVVITVILLLLLEAAKRFIFRSGRPSDYFYFNLLSCLQLFILLCIIIVVLTRALFRKFKVKRILLWQVLTSILVLVLIEMGCRFLLNHPKDIPAAVFPGFKYYYDHFECRIIQYEPATTVFDNSLYYKFKPNNSFVHSNHEYSNSYAINSKGFRDDERSLQAPDVICLGDSYTLGWGADKTQNYPALIEQQTKLNVLNAGMSSYGTARESMLLADIDTTQVKYIVWQYCANDEEENDAYLSNNRSLKPHTKASLDSLMELHKWTRQYFPGRHFFTIAKLSVSQFRQGRQSSSQPVNDSAELKKAKNFLDIVTASPINLSKTKLIVFDLGPYPLQNRFIQHLKNLVEEKELNSKILLLDCTTILNKNDFYTLDVHLTPEGNEKMANAITNLISNTP